MWITILREVKMQLIFLILNQVHPTLGSKATEAQGVTVEELESGTLRET